MTTMAYPASATLPRQHDVPPKLPNSQTSRSVSPVRRRRGNRDATDQSQSARFGDEAAKPKLRLLVDYTKTRANLADAAPPTQSQSERVLRLRRVKSLDKDEREKYALRKNDDKHNSSSSAVDWHKLGNELKWEEVSNHTQSAVVQKRSRPRNHDLHNRQHHSAQNLGWRPPSFLKEPLGSTPLNAKEEESLELPKDIVVPALVSEEDNLVITMHSSNRAGRNRKSRSASPKRAQTAPSTTVSPVKPKLQRLTSGPPPFNHLGLAHAHNEGASVMEEGSMRLKDVFGMPDKSAENQHSHDYSSGTAAEHHRAMVASAKKSTATLVEEDDDDDDDNSTESLLQRLTQGAIPAPPVSGRLYRTVSATMSAFNVVPTPISPPNKNLAPQQQPPPPMDDISSLTNDDPTARASLSFQRRNSKTSPSSSSPTKRKSGRGRAHLGGGLALQPWDDEFNNSLSSMSSYCESMDDDSYQRDQARRAGKDNGGGLKRGGVSGGQKDRKYVHRTTSLSLEASGEGDMDSENDDEEEDLLFLPAPTAAAAAAAAKTAATASRTASRGGDNVPKAPPTSWKAAAPVKKQPRQTSAGSKNSVPRNESGSGGSMGSSSGRMENSFRRLVGSGAGGGLENSSSIMQFAIRRANSGSEDRKKLQGSLTSLGSSGGCSSDPNMGASSEKVLDYMDESEKKRHWRDELIRSNPSFRRSHQNPKKSGEDKSKPSAPAVGGGNLRGNLSKQLSCQRLDCEYERFAKENRQDLFRQIESSHSSSRRNAALLVRADSVPRNVNAKARNSPELVGKANSNHLISARRQAPQQVMSRSQRHLLSGTGGSKAKLSTHSKSPHDGEIAADPGNAHASNRNKSRSSSPGAGKRTHMRKVRPISRCKSFDDDCDDDSEGEHQNAGFRDSLLRQASFVTGSRIRRLNNNNNPGVSTSSGNNRMHDFDRSLPNLKF